MSLGPEMRRMEAAVKNGTVSFESSPLPSSEGDADSRMDALRPELYAVTGLIAPFAVKEFIGLKDIYPPYGLPEGSITWGRIPKATNRTYPPMKATSFNTLYQGLLNAAKLAAHDFSVPEEYEAVADRINTLVRAAHEIDPEEKRYNSSRLFILAGLNTAIEMSLGALSGIYTLAKAERKATSKQDFINIAGRSPRLASVIASFNIDQTGPVRRAIQTFDSTDSSTEIAKTLPFFNINLLKFYPDPEAEDAYVGYTKPLAQLYDPWTGMKIGDISSTFKTLTCPALPTIGKNESLIKTIWNHTTNLSADVKFRES